MKKRTITEEIDRIHQINEYGYDYDDVSRQSSHNPIKVSDLNGKNINKNAVSNWLSRSEKEEKKKLPSRKHLLDINNHKDKMVIFNSLSKKHNINNATEETLKTYRRLRDNQRYPPMILSISNELELEYAHYLLRFNKYGIRNGFGTGFHGLHLSSTFNSVLNKEQNGFKRNVEPSYEDFKKFMIQNKNVFEKEIIDYITNHK
jgi:hypothetical protein